MKYLYHIATATLMPDGKIQEGSFAVELKHPVDSPEAYQTLVEQVKGVQKLPSTTTVIRSFTLIYQGE